MWKTRADTGGRAIIRFDLKAGSVKVTPYGLTVEEAEELDPTKEEAAAIAKAITGAELPRSMPTGVRNEPPGVDPKTLIRYQSLDGKATLFIEQRIEKDFDKVYVPWTYFTDGRWRKMEPDDGLPLYGLNKLRQSKKDIRRDGMRFRAMVHEGGSVARALWENPVEDHPWAADLRTFVHLGWAGGAHSAHRVDWRPLIQSRMSITISADNDPPGVEAVRRISELMAGRRLACILFDDRFPRGFDLKDPWPQRPEWWRGPRYIGPSIEDMSFPATWATRTVEPKGKGRPAIIIRPEFLPEWYVVSRPAVFVHRHRPHIELSKTQSNQKVRPFSDVEDTARLMLKSLESQVDRLDYNPGQLPGVVTSENQRVINTYRPSAIRPEKGDVAPWVAFLEYLIPNKTDRFHLMRWIATLVARPDVKMTFGVLLTPDTQGVGKGTLGEAILAPLVGLHNTSFPDESALIDSNFNSWRAHKRLAVCHEIYQGQSKKAYDRLKSVVTDKEFEVHRKYLEPYRLASWIHVFANSNSPAPLRMAVKDRRWLVPLVTDAKRPADYWRGFHLWLHGGGLAAIAHWAAEFVEEHGPVLSGEEAPMTAAKQDIIDASRSEGAEMAFDFAQSVAGMKGRAVVRVDEVRAWVARERELSLNDAALESPLTLRKAMKEGGLFDPVRSPDPSKSIRVVIERRSVYVMANFQIPEGATWADLRPFEKSPPM